MERPEAFNFFQNIEHESISIRYTQLRSPLLRVKSSTVQVKICLGIGPLCTSLATDFMVAPDS